MSQMINTDLMRSALESSNRDQGIHSAMQLGKDANVSDTAVRKAFKALKQHLPERILIRDGKYTDLGKNLVLQYFGRPENVNGAQWINCLSDVLASLPETLISEPQDVDYLEQWETARKEHESTSLSLRSESAVNLARYHQLMEDDDFGSDVAWQAELQAIKDLSYTREIQRNLAMAEGKYEAREHLKGGKLNAK